MRQRNFLFLLQYSMPFWMKLLFGRLLSTLTSEVNTAIVAQYICYHILRSHRSSSEINQNDSKVIFPDIYNMPTEALHFMLKETLE